MKRVLFSLLLIGTFVNTSRGQGDVILNGKIDNLLEFSTVYSEEFIMHDSTKLMTDVYLPIMRDCLMVPVSIPIPTQLQAIFGSQPIEYNLELIPRNTQYIIYDSLNGQPNPNPYKLPMVLTRTPYDKGDQNAGEAPVMNLLGYAFLKQDQRGRYASEGVYLPLTSDGWNKGVYHPNFQHVLDATDPSDPKNGNKHEDGFDTWNYIKHRLVRDYDLDGDGITDTTDLVYSGRFAMFGASALGYNQYQAAAAHMIDENEPGCKALMPIVAPADFYKGVGFPNGVLRDRLVTGWLKGQIFTGTDDDLIPIDNDMQNNIHSSADYNLPQSIVVNSVVHEFQQNKFDAANLAIDHFASVQYEDQFGNKTCGYYPNFVGRAEIDVSRAPVDANGEANINGEYSRFGNMEVPAYHLGGWWDIFVDSQTESWANMRRHLSTGKFNRPGVTNRELQKLVLGPWAHQTTGSLTTGDRTYPDNVSDLLGINFDDFSETNIPIDKALNSEVIGWFRYNLNYAPGDSLGEPKFVLPESDNLYPFADLGLAGHIDIRVPAAEVRLPYTQLIGVLTGVTPLTGLKAELVYTTPFGGGTIPIDLPDIPLSNVIPGLNATSIHPIPYRDFADPSEIPNVRLYIVGPNNDTEPQNVNLSNYWLGVDTFPLPEGRDWDAIQRTTFFLHQDGTLDNEAPTTDEGFKMYVHDPDDPIRTVGGANMIVKTPDGERDAQGQFNLKDPRYEPYTMNRPGVISFESAPVKDSLCVIGYPTVKLYAKSNIGGLDEGPTDTDFHIRIVDVYPDGREYFVQDGQVNARARDYVRMLVEEPWKDYSQEHPGDDIPFTNINIGEIYEYVFEMLPIGYTFGDGHKIKILISSSNYNRFQVNPNIPIMPGEFFRRKPGDGKTYIFEGEEYSPRVAIQRVHFSPEHPTQISLPIYTKQYTGIDDPIAEAKGPQMLVYPNPVNDFVSIYMDNGGTYNLKIMSVDGALIRTEQNFRDNMNVDVSTLSQGIYFVELTDTKTNERFVQKFSKL
ncbi:MAG: CocE/NonD family hydrolase [Flavobacteriales bacterium]|nr:CocE/NonD family hydrolase [Flavobacteriales bacterium]